MSTGALRSGRRRIFRVVWVALVLSSTLLGAETASTAVESEPAEPLVLSAVRVGEHPKLTVIATVPNSVSSEKITEASFRVTEGGELRTVTAVRLPSAQLSVVLVIDTSKSMEGAAMDAARRAATTFVIALPADVPVAVVGFGNVPTVASPFGTDKIATKGALAKLRPRGNTTLYDALVQALKLLGDRKPGPEDRQAIVLLTDGGDTRSVASLAETSAALKASGVSLTAIGLATRESDQAALSSLASSAGGVVVPASDPGALDGVFKRVADSVLNQYELSWVTSKGGPTAINVELAVGALTFRGSTVAALPALTIPPEVLPKPGQVNSPVLQPRTESIVAVAPNDRWLWLIGISSGFGALFFAWVAIMWPTDAKRRLAGEYSSSDSIVDGGSFGTTRFGVLGRSVLFGRAVKFGNRLLRRRDPNRRLFRLLERAGLSIRPEEAAVVAGLVAVVAAAVGLFLFGPIVAVLATVLSIFALLGWVSVRADKRSSVFGEQFESTLQIMANSLKAGYGITQAIDTVAREAEAPTRDEFLRVVREARLGMDQIVALGACADRIKSQDLAWVTDAIAVNRDVGGNLTELFAAVAETIRSRNRLSRQVIALSAEGKISARIMMALPFLMFGWFSLTNRSYAQELFHGPGPLMLVASALSMTIGYLWLRRIIRVEY